MTPRGKTTKKRRTSRGRKGGSPSAKRGVRRPKLTADEAAMLAEFERLERRSAAAKKAAATRKRTAKLQAAMLADFERLAGVEPSRPTPPPRKKRGGPTSAKRAKPKLSARQLKALAPPPYLDENTGRMRKRRSPWIDKAKPGKVTVMRGKRRPHSDGGFHFAREVGLFFPKPIPPDQAFEQFSEWADEQLALFDAWVISEAAKVGKPAPALRINSKMWGKFAHITLQAHDFVGREVLASQWSASERIDAWKAWLDKMAKSIKRRAAESGSTNERLWRIEPKAVGFSLYLTTSKVGGVPGGQLRANRKAKKGKTTSGVGRRSKPRKKR